MRRKWVVEGRVQGVGYRRATQVQALRLGLTGWVRNREDGAVELVGEGSETALAALERWCRQGPPGAAVTAVTEADVGSEESEAPLAQSFDIRR